jgi:hypothetical protein
MGSLLSISMEIHYLVVVELSNAQAPFRTLRLLLSIAAQHCNSAFCNALYWTSENRTEYCSLAEYRTIWPQVTEYEINASQSHLGPFLVSGHSV